MYVTTFCSFKGGVGRTMALVNAGVELALRGRKVLLVDFDLEAPGLDTFDCLKFPKEVPGIVDFVNEYCATGRAPDVAGYVEKCAGIGEDEGELLLIPAGINKSTYAGAFRQIDWADLYERRDGYLLLEDLKAQWKEVIQPDYVLIDSRTGHTDVGAICTRQLPDSVAILFFPNEQNLIGLTKAVADIRSECNEPQSRQIELHFIMSNVPDLDDEDLILAQKIKAFQQQLGFEKEPLIVHRYDSLSLLNQMVFTKDRPRSRLAGEYRRIVREIARGNLRDRVGVLDYLVEATRTAHLRSVEFESTLETDSKLSTIEKVHKSDGEVLFRLGVLRQERWEPKRAASLFKKAIQEGYENPQVHLRRARVLSESDQHHEAQTEAIRALQYEGLSPSSITQAPMLTGPDQSSEASASPAFVSLGQTEQIGVAHDLFFDVPELRETALLMLRSITKDAQLQVESSERRSELARVYIAVGRFEAAAELLASEAPKDFDLRTAFNYAMASWGLRGSADAKAFRRVIQIHEDKEESSTYNSANYFQCMALSYWAIGNVERAGAHADKAVEESYSYSDLFTCWRYRDVSAAEFIEDIQEMLKFFAGDVLIAPPFLSPDPSFSDFAPA